MTTEIQLTRGYVAIVDDCDADLAELRWCARIGSHTAYATRAIGKSRKNPVRVTLSIHRVILSRVLGRELTSDEWVDHANGDGLDNRRSNLRLATISENARNSKRPVTSTTGYKGVTINDGKYRAQISVGNKKIHLGYHATPELAHEAYKAAAIKYHGEFARFE